MCRFERAYSESTTLRGLDDFRKSIQPLLAENQLEIDWKLQVHIILPNLLKLWYVCHLYLLLVFQSLLLLLVHTPQVKFSLCLIGYFVTWCGTNYLCGWRSNHDMIRK